jgi:predicted Rossmann-fold nucleotide-binding protein
MPRTHRGPREISAKPPISRGFRYVAVCGASEATPTQLDAAREVGRLLAESGAIVINGGLGGVSGAASEGAARAGGMVVGLLPDTDRVGAIARSLGRSVTVLDSWSVKGLDAVKTPEEAVKRALEN